MKRKLLIITQAQFGSLIDYFQYSLNLRDKYEIEYICWDYNRPKMVIQGINIQYISRNGNLFKRNILFLKFICIKIKSQSFDRIFVNYFRGSFLLPFIVSNKKQLFLDIRTASVSSSLISRISYNVFLRFECFFFDNLSVISTGVKKRLMLPKSTIVIPLGANYINVERKLKMELNLLYVGTLENRNIEKTVEGIWLFLNKYKNVILKYKIIGSGDEKSILKIKKTIEMYSLENVIILYGYIPYEDLISFYKESNVGVSFVPITNYYNYQPVTKTFEYLMSGLPVIATSTYENKLIINNSNGVLIEDNSNSFCFGLSQILKLLPSYDNNLIKDNLKEYQWKNIVAKLDYFLLSN